MRISRRLLLQASAAAWPSIVSADCTALDGAVGSWLNTLPKGITPSPPNSRIVGVDYNTWFAHKPWHNTWSTPLAGEYVSSDPKRIMLHADQLESSFVDFLLIDWSNDTDFKEGYRVFDSTVSQLEAATTIVYETLASNKRKLQASILLGVPTDPSAFENGHLQRKADQVYEDLVNNKGRGKNYFFLDGKPLLVVYVGTPSPFRYGLPTWDDRRFTVRFMTGYLTEQPNLINGLVSKYGYWSWEDRGPQTYSIAGNHPEFMRVLPSWSPNPDKRSKGYGTWQVAGRKDGLTFKNEWQRARHIGPKIVLAGFFNAWAGAVQNNSIELSKDIEPSSAFGDEYLQLLKSNAFAFKKGV